MKISVFKWAVVFLPICISACSGGDTTSDNDSVTGIYDIEAYQELSLKRDTSLTGTWIMITNLNYKTGSTLSYSTDYTNINIDERQIINIIQNGEDISFYSTKGEQIHNSYGSISDSGDFRIYGLEDIYGEKLNNVEISAQFNTYEREGVTREYLENKIHLVKISSTPSLPTRENKSSFGSLNILNDNLPQGTYIGSIDVFNEREYTVEYVRSGESVRLDSVYETQVYSIQPFEEDVSDVVPAFKMLFGYFETTDPDRINANDYFAYWPSVVGGWYDIEDQFFEHIDGDDSMPTIDYTSNPTTLFFDLVINNSTSYEININLQDE